MKIEMEHIKKALEENRKWVDTDGVEGEIAVFENQDFSGMDLSGFDFSLTVLNGCSFEGANLKGAHFSGAEANQTIFKGANCEKTEFGLCNLVGADFTDVNLRYADFRMASLIDASFGGADLAFTDFEGADVQKTNFVNAKYENALNFKSCNLEDSYLDSRVENHDLQIKRRTKKFVDKLVEDYDNEWPDPVLGVFYYVDETSGHYVCCDNNSGHAWIEEAYRKEDAIAWLNDEIEIDELYERNEQYERDIDPVQPQSDKKRTGKGR